VTAGSASPDFTALVSSMASSVCEQFEADYGLAIGPLPQPSERSLFEIRNGRQMQSVSRTWTIPVRPTAVGEHTIPPLELLVDGAAVRTNELRLHVVADLRGEELGFLEVRPSNPRAIALYESEGFVHVGRRKGYYQAEAGREDALVLKLDLDAGRAGRPA
jgi:hypothetical protein